MGFCGQFMHIPSIHNRKPKAVKSLMNTDRFLHVFWTPILPKQTPTKFGSWWSRRQTIFGTKWKMV